MSEARQYFIMHDGPIGDGKPWKAYMEASPGLTIGTTDHTEPFCRVSGYLRDAKANAELLVKLLNENEAGQPRSNSRGGGGR
jgi:hypothetical protein